MGFRLFWLSVFCLVVLGYIAAASVAYAYEDDDDDSMSESEISEIVDDFGGTQNSEMSKSSDGSDRTAAVSSEIQSEVGRVFDDSSAGSAREKYPEPIVASPFGAQDPYNKDYRKPSALKKKKHAIKKKAKRLGASKKAKASRHKMARYKKSVGRGIASRGSARKKYR